MNNKIIYGIFSLVLLFTAACKREKTVGDEEKFASSNFAVLTAFDVNKANVNFTISNLKTLDPLFFSATFNEEVSWTIHIEGDSSTATKDIKGKSTVIDINNAVWQGESNGPIQFSKEDTCTVSLTILGVEKPIVLAKKIYIGAMWSQHNRKIDGVRYFVVEDFEDQSSAKAMTSVSTDQADNGSPAYAFINGSRAQGLKSLHMQGFDANGNGWLISANHLLLTEIVSANTVADTAKNLSSTNPNDFYFNIYIKGYGKANTTIELKAYEVDSAESKLDLFNIIKAGYVYTTAQQGTNDGWIYDIVVDWEGWKLVSIPYNKFRAANDLAFGGNGNRIKEPWKITGLAVSLLAFPTVNVEVEADVDNIVLTEGGPYKAKFY